MQEKDGRAAAGYVVSDFGVIRTDDLHAAIISTVDWRGRLCPQENATYWSLAVRPLALAPEANRALPA
jgi:hypothetical protein